MKNCRNEIGASKFGVFLLTVILIVVGYGAIKYIPIKLDSYEFQDYMERLARDPSYNEDEIIKALLQKAKDLNIPLTESQIKVDISGGRCEIIVDYEIIINTPIMQKKLEFHPRVSERRIL